MVIQKATCALTVCDHIIFNCLLLNEMNLHALERKTKLKSLHFVN